VASASPAFRKDRLVKRWSPVALGQGDTGDITKTWCLSPNATPTSYRCSMGWH